MTVNPVPQLVEILQRGSLALFVGADLPRQLTGLPGRADLAVSLARRLGLSGPPPAWPDVAARYEAEAGRNALIRWLRDQLDLPGQQPGPIYGLLAQLPVLTYITAAYDPWLHDALRAAGRRPNPPVVDASSLGLRDPHRPTVAPLLGVYDRPESLALTAADLRQIPDSRRQILAGLVHPTLANQSVLILGQDLRDAHFQTLYQSALFQAGTIRPPAFAVWPGLADWEVQTWIHQEVRVVDLPVLDLLRELLGTRSNRPDDVAPPNSDINSPTCSQVGGLVNALHSLAERIENAYDLGGLERLSQFLDVKWENIAGATLYQKAYGLASQMQRQGRLPELLDRLRQERGHLDWRQGLDVLFNKAAVGVTPPAAQDGRLPPLTAEVPASRPGTMQFARLHVDPDSIDRFPLSGLLRELLVRCFPADGDLKRFCQDHADFRPILSKFGSGQGLDDMVDRVIEHCETFVLLDELLEQVARVNPLQYARFENRLKSHSAVHVTSGAPIVVETRPAADAPATATPPASEVPPPVEPQPPRFHDFELLVGDPVAGLYPVQVLGSPAGQGEGTFIPPLAEAELADLLARLERGATDEALLSGVGIRLFRALFDGDVRARYAESTGMIAAGLAAAGLRLRLRLASPELQALPWELLRDPEKREFLVLSRRVLVTRYLHVPRPTPPLAVEPPLRILVALAAPQDQPPLDVEVEAGHIRQALQPLIAGGQVALSVEPHVTKRGLRRCLLDANPHVLHYVGHGGLDRGRGLLFLENGQGQTDPLDGATLGTLLKASQVRLAVLNACQSARDPSPQPSLSLPALAATERGSRSAFLGVGPALVDAGLGAVVAMQFALPDTSGRIFAEDFYGLLARFRPVDECVSLAREALLLEAGIDRADWATPVLLMRAPDGLLFRPAT